MNAAERHQPTFKECMTKMRARDALTQEDGFHDLLPRASIHIRELIEEFEREEDHGLRCWLLELIGEGRSEDAFDLLCRWSQSSDRSLNYWAVRGLAKLDTKRSRTFMFENNLVDPE